VVISDVTPAIAEGTDVPNTLAFQYFGEIDQSISSDRGGGGACKEVLKFLLFLFSLRWELPNLERISLPEEIRHEDLGPQGLGQDISSLQSLGDVTALAGWYPTNTS